MVIELAVVTLVLFELVLLGVFAQYGREWLYGGIVVNLLLVSTLGAKTVSILGFTTNSGNIFYAAAVFATLLLVEIYGAVSARRSVLFGVLGVAFFVLAAQLVIQVPGTPETLAADEAMRHLFSFVPRVSAASLIALVVSQNVAISVYAFLKQKHKGHLLWLRNILSVAASQTVDCLIFFSIAFLGTVSSSTLMQFMLTGFVIKLAFGVLSTPFFYSNVVAIKDKTS